MKQKSITRLSLRVLIALVAVVMIFSSVSSVLMSVSAEDEVYRRNDSIVSDYTSFLNGSVVHQLPDHIKSDEVISVIIEIDAPTVMDAYKESGSSLSFSEYLLTEEAAQIRENIASEKARYMKALNEEGIYYTQGAEYSTVLAGFEVLVEANDFGTALKHMSDGASAMVGEVYNVAETQLVENKVSVYEDTGIFDSSSFPYDGSGMVVAVLDTGLDYTHPAFSTSNFTSTTLGLTKNDVAAHVANTAAAVRVPGLTADDVYINEKVPFSFDYADNDPDVYSLHNNHGTHVSGVIVGKDDVITGVAPNAQLVSMKIFSDTLESARASWILSALEDCVELGVDVINMSLGTACGFSREIDNEKMAKVYEEIRSLGISMVVAASNSFSSTYGSEKNGNLGLTSNPDTGTVGSPSTYPGAISIASIDGTKTPYILDEDGNIIYFLESTDSAGEEKYFFEELLGTSTETQELEYVLIPGIGSSSNYSGIDVKGKIALVKRGTNTFEEKAKAAEEAGAKAMIVYNNTSGDIKMNVGIVSIPVCSISQDDGEKLAAAKSGKLTISLSQKSGPFMSDFSSWGPSPSLEIKPEITAHGGNILSAVTGHGYDRLSGTSMACPNMAGAVALMRQYVLNEFPKDRFTDENGNIDYVEVNAIVNRLLMSTADVVYNKNGLPYAVRKQGAGLANLTEAYNTGAYLLTYKNGEVMDKTKVELGHDPGETGVYSFKFTIDNFGSKSLSYDISATVMTEGVSDTPTYQGERVVTAEGYILEGAKFEIVSVKGGKQNGTSVTVGAGEQCDVEVKITLSDSDKKYLRDSFENGMYIEGFVTLTSKDEGSTDLGLPFLAFFGNWYSAPLFDLDYFETDADALNDAIATLDKTLPDAYATRPIGGISEDYISYLGSYYFVQNPQNKIISANRDYIAISNAEGTVHSLRFVWGGQLRNAERIEITITDDATGEVIFEKTEVSVRKSYGDGGSYIYPTNIEIEFDAAEHNLKNNSTYSVKLVGYLEYGDGGVDENLKNTFEFPLTVDFEAPALTGVEFYTEYDKEEKKTRLFAKMAVYDNHYAMGMQIGYVGTTTQYNAETGVNETVNMLFPFDKYITPIYSEKNGTTYVTYELTDHIFDIKNGALNKNTFAVTFYDYAVNEATYEVELPDDFQDFYLEETDITINVNEVYTISANVYPEREWDELLEFSASSKAIRIVNNKIVGVSEGKSRVFIQDKTTGKIATMNVTVVNEKTVSKPVADVFKLTDYYTEYAFYVMSNEDRHIGETGDSNIFVSDKYSLSMYPGEKVQLHYKLDAYFPDETTVQFTTGNDKVATVDENGRIVATGEGYTSITIRVLQDGKRTRLSKTVSIEVKDPYVRTGPTLNNYYGAGTMNTGRVDIPEDMLFTSIGQYAFSNYNYISKDLEAGDVIDEEEPDYTKIAYIGNDFITEVIIPEGVETIGPYAFAGLTALKKITLPSTLEAIEYGAFFGCTSLETVVGLENVKLINKYAFQYCNIKNDLSLDNAHAIGDYAFAGNMNLGSVKLSKNISSVGAYAFMGNRSLTNFDVSESGSIKYGDFAFLDCGSLEEITINSSVIPTGTFYGCSKLTTLNIGKNVSSIGEYALSGTAITEFNVHSDNKTYYPVTSKEYLLDKDGTTLLMVAPGASGVFTLDGITRIGHGAFSGNTKITEVNMPKVTYVDNYAFSECRGLKSVSLGSLEYIGDYAFLLTDITALPSLSSEKLTSIGSYAFAFTLIEEVSIKDGMTVGSYAFNECELLKKVTIGDNVKLGEGAFLRSPTTVDPRITDPDSARYLNQKVSVDTETGFYYYEYLSSLTSLTIGKNADIGKGAFMGSAKLIAVSLGEGAKIGEMAFYNCPKLLNIDLSGAKRIGKMAFSGDNNWLFTSSSMNSIAVKDKKELVTYYSSSIVNVSLISLESDGLDEQAFIYCRKLTTVTLGDEIRTVPYMAFASCPKLTSVSLGGVTVLGYGAFSETGLAAVDLSSISEIGDLAFASCESLTTVKFSPDGATVGEGAFNGATALINTENFGKLTAIGDNAFAYTDIREADLTSAVTVGDYAFLKGEKTDYIFKLTLGESLVSLGDNPFAFCTLAPLYSYEGIEFNGNKLGERVVYTFDISDNVKVINGSIYTVVPYGLELTTYVGLDENGVSLDRENVIVDENTVRISGFAFAGTDVQRAVLPHKLNSIGHKAFYACEKLNTVVFKSYTAPVLEEEFDPNYYSTFENIPHTGEYEFSYMDDTDGDGAVDSIVPVTLKGLGVVPFYMWNASDGKYSNVYYGASFADYIGHNSYDNMGKLIMVAPSNGVGYDTFIMSQYFTHRDDGDIALDDNTVNAIEAIDRLPSSVTLADEELVIAARAAYNKVSSAVQKALITNYDKLRRAEELIAALKAAMEPTVPDAPVEPNDPVVPDVPTDEPSNNGAVIGLTIALVTVSLLLAGALGFGAYYFLIRKKRIGE